MYINIKIKIGVNSHFYNMFEKIAVHYDDIAVVVSVAYHPVVVESVVMVATVVDDYLHLS